MKTINTTVSANPKHFNIIALVFGVALVGAIIFALCTGNLQLLRGNF